MTLCSIFQILGSYHFHLLAYHVIQGNQLIVRGKYRRTVQSALNTLKVCVMYDRVVGPEKWFRDQDIWWWWRFVVILRIQRSVGSSPGGLRLHALRWLCSPIRDLQVLVQRRQMKNLILVFGVVVRPAFCSGWCLLPASFPPSNYPAAALIVALSISALFSAICSHPGWSVPACESCRFNWSLRSFQVWFLKSFGKSSWTERDRKL